MPDLLTDKKLETEIHINMIEIPRIDRMHEFREDVLKRSFGGYKKTTAVSLTKIHENVALKVGMLLHPPQGSNLLVAIKTKRTKYFVGV